jgi:hypothetical protein
MGYTLWHRGRKKRVFSVGRKLLRFGWKNADSRSQVMGYCCIGWSRLIDGDVGRAAACFQKAVGVSADPWYAVFPQLALCYGLISEGKIREAQTLIGQIIEFSCERGAEFAGTPAVFFKGILLVSEGRLSKGLFMLEQQLAHWKTDGSRLRYALCGCILAEIYAKIACRLTPLRPAVWFKNLGAALSIAPFAARKATTCFARYIHAADEIGAQNVVGRAYLQWGLMQQIKGRRVEADQCYHQALDCFSQCDSKGYMAQAREALQTLKQV